MSIALALAAAQPVAAADIVVTGRGLAPPRGEAPYGAVELDRERLAAGASTRLEDVLREVPGLQLFRRSDSRSANPTSQGVTLRGLGGNASSRALLVLDGVPQTDPFGGWIAWPAYDPRRLALARVTRGGGSGVHGPGALAGTIELESAGADEAAGLRATLAHGSRNSLDGFAGLGLPLGAGFAHLSLSHARGDGFVPVVAGQRGPADRPASYRQSSAALRAALPLASAVELQASLSAFADRRERGTAFSGIATDGADASLRLVGSGRLPFAALVYVQSRHFSNRFAALDAARATVTPTLDQYNVPATGLGARVELRPALGRAELRTGADWRRVEGETRELYQFAAGAPTRHRRAGGGSDTLGAFAELSGAAGPLTLAAAARIDHWRIGAGRFEERALAGGPPLADLRFAPRAGWEPTARAGLAWRASDALALRLAAYRGWRLPTLNELYRPFRLGPDATAANEALRPERLSGVEAGAELRPAPGLRLAATLFANRLHDPIANVTLGAGPGNFPGVGFVAGEFRRRDNLDAVVSRGFELDGSIEHGPWRLSAGYSFAAARIRAAGAAALLDGLRPAQTPRHAASATLAWRGEAARASLGLNYVGAQYEDDRNRQLIPDALTLDAYALLPLTRRLGLELRGENLTDARIVAGISGAGIIERAAPRTLWIGLRWLG